MSKKRGNIIILAAPSGAGKTTLSQRLRNDFKKIRFSVSATTRPPRKGETDGKDYNFLSHNEFQDYIDSGKFLEWEEFYNGNRYGTLRSNVEKQRDKGYFVLLDIDVLGACTVKKIYGDEALGIFIKPPSLDVLKERLEKRGTESDDLIRTRLERAVEEITYADRFDEIVVNDDLDKAYDEIKNIVDNFLRS